MGPPFACIAASLRMIRLVPLIGSLLLAPTAARAGDFTGFYAGVNAGYGREHEETKGTGRIPSPPLPEGGVADGLPPSASAAASALRRAGPGRSATGR